MSNVYANSREISAKKDANKSVCAMPDVCLSPPSPPAGPIPIPYPNTATASDTSEGSKTVKIGGQEVGLKNKSNYKESKGNEAATRSLGMGVVTHTIQGKMKHAAWSMDIKIEGENVIRHMDLTTHNHINQPNIAITLDAAKVTAGEMPEPQCEALKKKREAAEKSDLKKGKVQPRETMAAARYEDPTGATRLIKGVSHPNAMIKSSVTNGYCGEYSGKDWPMEMFKDKNGKMKPKLAKGPVHMACEKNKQEHDPSSIGHAESRIIEDIIFAAAKRGVSMPPGPVGSLKLSINYPHSDPKQANLPCSQCKKLICEAQACGLDVTICDGKEEKRPKCSEDGKWQGLEPVHK